MAPPPRDQILRCGPTRGLESCGVAPPRGSNPTLWPLPWDRILQHGRSRGIESYGVALLVLLGIGDRTFHYGPSRGIRLSTVAPPRGSDFPLWPLPGDQTFRYSPSWGIGLSALAPTGGSRATPWDCSNILSEYAGAFKGTTCEKCVDGGTILPKAKNIHA